MVKKYFVQTLCPEGDILGSMHTAQQIINLLGYRDCSGAEFEVYDVSTFGKVVKLVEQFDSGMPSNYHRLTSAETGENVIEGFSTEH